MFKRYYITRCAALYVPVSFFIFELFFYWMDLTLLGLWGGGTLLLESMHSFVVVVVCFWIGRMARRYLDGQPVSDEDRKFLDASISLPLLWTLIPVLAILVAPRDGAILARRFLFEGGTPVMEYLFRYLGAGVVLGESPVSWADISGLYGLKLRLAQALSGIVAVIVPWSALLVGAIVPSVYEHPKI